MLSLFRRHERRPDLVASTGPDEQVASLADRDLALLTAARAGEADAIDELYRLHLPVARGVANGLCRRDDVDDVVAEAFARVLAQLREGRGPRVSFRAYLITAVRSCATDLARKSARLVWTDDVEADAPLSLPTDDSRPDSPVRQESRLLAEALDALPPRWQLVLWWSTVEQRSLHEVGERLGINANAAAALAFRARDGLRDAYVRLHVPASDDAGCAACRTTLAAAVRSRADAPPADAVPHLSACGPCREVASELAVMRTALAGS